MSALREFFANLATHGLAWITVTLLCFVFGEWVFRKTRKNALMNPVLIAVALIALLLVATGTSYARYFEAAQPIHLMLGPATVALAVPLQQNFARVKASLLPLAAALLAGSLTAVVVAVGVAYALGVGDTGLLSIAPKSATAPVAMGVSAGIGGSESLTAVIVVLTGIFGAVIALPLLDAIRVKDWRARGFAMGVVSHGIGTARAMESDEEGGAFAGMGMGLNALLTAVLVPILVALYG